LIFLADSGLRTQAMNLDGVLVGGSAGVVVPEGDGIPLFDGSRSLRDEKIPERMAMPNVPMGRKDVSIHGFTSGTYIGCNLRNEGIRAQQDGTYWFESLEK
jgi:hypothetical protein